MTLDLLEYVVMWVASKLLGASGDLEAEVIELRNWLLCFGCALEEFRVVVDDLEDWMANSPPPLVFLACSDCMLHNCIG